MTARATFTHPVLPLDGIDTSTPPESVASVEGEAQPLGPQYIRLFGNTPPDKAIRVSSFSLAADPASGPPRDFCDPIAAAGHLSDMIAGGDHPSTATLADIAALRLHHLAKGHAIAADAAHGPVFFMVGAREWFGRAMRTADPAKRRKCLIAAAAMLVALIDAETFTRTNGAHDER